MTYQNTTFSPYCLSLSSDISKNQSKSSITKEIIINWLFDKKEEERIKTFSLVNYDICHTIIKMYDKFSFSNKIKFKINLKDKKPIISQTDNIEDLSEQYKCHQKLFLKEIRFYKIKQSNDAMTLSNKILNNKNLFTLFLNELSKQKFLSKINPVNFDQKQGTCSSPIWIDENEYYTISEIIIGYFENILNIKYFLSKKKKNDNNDSFNNFFEKRNLILDLIKSSSYNENLYDIIDLKEIIKDAINDKTLINDEERRLANKKLLSGLNKSFRMYEPPIEYNANSYYYKYKEMLMEKSSELLDNLIFFGFEGQSAIDQHINERIIDEFYAYAEKKKTNDILLEISEEGFLTNKKKKPRRKKNKKRNNEIHEEETKINNDDEHNNFDKGTKNNIVNNIRKVESNEEDIKGKIVKNKDDNNENNNSTISNSSHNNNKDNNINNIESFQTKIYSTNEIISSNSFPEKYNTQTEFSSDIIIDKNENRENKIHFNEKSSIDMINDSSNEIEAKDEDQKESESIEKQKESFDDINNKNNKKKKKKKTKKKNHLTSEELNNIYTNFYNENNDLNNVMQNKLSTVITPIQSHNKNSNKDKNEQLHNLIIGFQKKIHKKILSLHEKKYNSIVLLCQKIKDHFKCGLSIIIYGSYSIGLELEESDIDISVELSSDNSNIKQKNNISQKTTTQLIYELNNYLSNFPEFKGLNPIVATKIPILKMTIEKDNNKTKVDLTFNLKQIKATINFYINTIKRYPQIKLLVLLIKHLVKKNNLSNVYEGGFSSHSIFIMVASNVRQLLKNKNSLNLGDLLISFLHFYGKIFNYTNTTIDLMNKSDPYIINEMFSNVPIFIDPISKINVSKSSYLHEKIKMLFSNTYDKLIQGEDNLYKTFEEIFS